jgi:hypothetical protein
MPYLLIAQISWIGVSRDTANNPPHPWTFGSSDRHWKKQGTMLGNVLYTDVKTGGPAIRLQPSYVVSISMAANSYRMVGSSSIDKQTKNGFRFYLGMFFVSDHFHLGGLVIIDVLYNRQS